MKTSKQIAYFTVFFVFLSSSLCRGVIGQTLNLSLWKEDPLFTRLICDGETSPSPIILSLVKTVPYSTTETITFERSQGHLIFMKDKGILLHIQPKKGLIHELQMKFLTQNSRGIWEYSMAFPRPIPCDFQKVTPLVKEKPIVQNEVQLYWTWKDHHYVIVRKKLPKLLKSETPTVEEGSKH